MPLFHDLSPAEQDEVITSIYDRFAGNLSTYAIRLEFGETAAYVPSTYESDDPEKQGTVRKIKAIVDDIGTADWSPAVVRAHLDGRYLIGVYPIAADSTVSWFALDFDKKKDEDPDPWHAALQQAEILRTEAKLTTCIERSQSGKGFHVWGFLDGPMNAGHVRHALARFIERTATYDRMFPNQNGIGGNRPLGNLIALPLHGGRLAKGNSAFVEPQGPFEEPTPVAQQFKLVKRLMTNAVAHMQQLFEDAGPLTPEREHTKYVGEAESLRDSFKMTHPTFGCEFIHWCWEHATEVSEPLWYAMLCNFAQFENGYELAHAFSARDTVRYNARATDKKYAQARAQNKPHTCETIRALGGLCECDRRFHALGRVFHPFDLASVSCMQLIDSITSEEEESSTSLADGIGDVLDWLAQVEEDPTIGRGLPTGIHSVDRSFGMRMAELTVLAARNSMGKTAAALQIGLDSAVQDDVAVKFFSLEMAKQQLMVRLLSAITGVTQTRMTSGQMTAKDWENVRDAHRAVARVPFFVDDKSMQLDTIIDAAARFVLEQQAAGRAKTIIIVDYLQIMGRLARENEQDQLARCVQGLKRFAKVMNCHVIALCQLNRGAEEAGGQEPKAMDSWLRGSDVIAFVADNVIFVLGDKGPGVVERTWITHKQRNGEAGIVLPLEFNQPIMRFGDRGTWGTSLVQATLPTRREQAPAVDGTGTKVISLDESGQQLHVRALEAPETDPADLGFLDGL